jgi:hypothetical protein
MSSVSEPSSTPSVECERTEEQQLESLCTDLLVQFNNHFNSLLKAAPTKLLSANAVVCNTLDCAILAIAWGKVTMNTDAAFPKDVPYERLIKFYVYLWRSHKKAKGVDPVPINQTCFRIACLSLAYVILQAEMSSKVNKITSLVDSAPFMGDDEDAMESSIFPKEAREHAV